MKMEKFISKKIGSIITIPTIFVIILIQLLWDKLPKEMSDIEYVIMIFVVAGIFFIISFLSLKIASAHFDLTRDECILNIQKSIEEHMDWTKDVVNEKEEKISEMNEAIKAHLKWAEGIIRVSQRLTFIDDDILGVFEKDATEIWVLTTTLEKDIGPLKESVFQNLKEGKNYTYFTPHKNFPGVENVEQNKLEYRRIYEEKFMSLPEDEKEKIGKYRFLEFPKETILFTTEIVIHNPSDKNKRRAFTYVEAKGSRILGEELVELTFSLTTHMVNILRPIKDREETISKELFELMWDLKLTKEDSLTLMAIARREILIAKKDIDKIVNSIADLSSHEKLTLEATLERFVVYSG